VLKERHRKATGNIGIMTSAVGLHYFRFRDLLHTTYK